MKASRTLLLFCALLSQLFLHVLPAYAQMEIPTLADLGAERLERCFSLEPATAEAILGEPVQDSWSLDSQYGYCTYASVATSDSRWSEDLLPTYGPLGKHQYVAATVWPVGNATDPFMYVAYAILDRSHGRLSTFIEKQGMRALEDLARAESSVMQLSRQYLPYLGEGALWYWQETSTGHHLAGIYALWQNQRVAVQALVAPGRGEDAVLEAMRQAVEELIVANALPAAPAPLTVDSCPNFSVFDAAAILQEPVNAEEPIGNLLFGPLPAWVAEEGFDQVVDGLCGYTSPAGDRILSDSAAPPLIKQTHLATSLDADHAVATSHVIGGLPESTSIPFSSDWFDLMLLAYAVGAANPQWADASVRELYGALTTGDFPDVLALLYRNAQADPSFKATKISPAEGHAHDDVLWLWQTVDDGYFSLLIGRQGTDFNVVAARLGNWVAEKTVLGYSQVVIEKMADAAAASRPATQLVADCDRLALATVDAIVGEPVQGHPVASAQGAGCKYTPVTDDLTVDSADFSGRFQTFGLLSGILAPKAAQQLLYDLVEQLFTDEQVADADDLGEVLIAILAEDFASALPSMAALEWHSNRWQVEAMTEASVESVLLRGETDSGWPQFIFLQNRAEGGLYCLTGVSHLEIDEVYPAIIAAADQLVNSLPDAR